MILSQYMTAWTSESAVLIVSVQPPENYSCVTMNKN